MFRGSIPQAMRAIVGEIVASWAVEDIYVGCSGNFTVERVLAEHRRLRQQHRRFALHGNDVTLYSSAIGTFLAGQPLRLALREEARADFGWLEPYLARPAEAVATVMLATRLVEGLHSDGRPKDNAYYRRMRPAFRRQWADLHARTVAKLEGLTLRLASYHCGDVVPWARTLPREAGFISYPPFFSGDYASMFGKLDALFAWDRPAYQEIGDGHITEFLEAITDRPYWAFGANRPQEAYAPYLRGVTQTTNRGVPIYVYASTGPRRVVTPRQETEPPPVPRLTPGRELGDTMQLARLTPGQFQALRSQYMNPGIKPGQASEAVGVLVEGLLVGVYAFSVAPTQAQTGLSTIYLLSDFPVAPSDYPRLSKLVLVAALSKESQLLAERLARRRIRRLLTTAFSNRPVSMKYRGLFRLRSRKENAGWTEEAARDPGAYYRQRYQINYVAEMGQWSLDEGLALWKKKHGKRVGGHPDGEQKA